MKIIKRIREHGIPLRITHMIMIVSTVAMMTVLLVEIFRSSSIYRELSDAADRYIELQNAATDLVAASDYLTDRVQHFTVMQRREEMDDYLNEIYVTRRRDKAISKMSEIAGDTEAFRQLQAAMSRSEALTEREFYAIRLVCDACGFTDLHEKIQSVNITPEHKALSADDKLLVAQQKVYDDSYYTQKEGIRSSMDSCIDSLIAHTHQVEMMLSFEMGRSLLVVKVFLFIQFAAMILVLWMTSHLGISPILKGVEKIKENRRMPVTGSYEFRYLARTYNKMYDAFHMSIERLNYDASHDKLTGLYNRAGYDVICSGIDIPSTAVLLIDADNFKDVNDTLGHGIGDKVLVKIAETLRHTFRHEDYICRMGGDEFLVFMLHMDEQRRDLIKLKTDLINKRLTDTSDGMPRITVSIGVAFGTKNDSMKDFLDHADEALYRVKNGLKCGCAFF